MSVSGLINPIEFPQAWDTLSVAGVQSPGIIPPGGVSGAKRTYKYDIKVGKGVKGSTTTFVGVPPAPFTVKFQLWTAKHFARWDLFRDLLKYDPTKKALQAFEVFHPKLSEVDITSVVTTDIGATDDLGSGLYSITVEFLEYLPPPPVSTVSTANGSKPAPDEWMGADPGDPQKSEIAKAQAQIKELSKAGQKP